MDPKLTLDQPVDLVTATDYIRSHDARAVKLSRMAKGMLATTYRAQHPGGWTAEPPETWNKDELVNSILDVEYPDIRAAREVRAASVTA